MLREAHARGLKVIIDQVWSHTSDQHPWFLESSASRDNPRADWYVWADPKADGTPPNNWLASFGGAGVDLVGQAPAVLPAQLPARAAGPELLEPGGAGRGAGRRASSGSTAASTASGSTWSTTIVHDRQLRDNPSADRNRTPLMATDMQFHRMDRSQPENLAFIARLRALMDSYGERMTVGEIGDEPPLPRQQEYTERRTVCTPPTASTCSPACPARRRCSARRWKSWANAHGWPSWSLGNHDVDALPDPHGAQRPAHGARAPGGADGHARHDLPLPGRRARPAGRPRAVRAAAGPVRDRRLRRRRGPRRRAHADALDQRRADGRLHRRGGRLAADGPGATCRWRSSARRRPRRRC